MSSTPRSVGVALELGGEWRAGRSEERVRKTQTGEHLSSCFPTLSSFGLKQILITILYRGGIGRCWCGRGSFSHLVPESNWN